MSYRLLYKHTVTYFTNSLSGAFISNNFVMTNIVDIFQNYFAYCLILKSHYRVLVSHFPMSIYSFHDHAATAAKSLQSCPTLCDPIDGSPPGSPVPGILQARTYII